MKKKILIISLVAVLSAILIVIIMNYKNTKKQYQTETITYEYFKLNNNNQYGIINKNGEIIIDTKYSNVEIPNPSKAVFFCYEEESYTVLNEKGDEIFQEYEKIMPIKIYNSNSEYEKEVLLYQADAKYGIIDYSGEKLTEAKYEAIDSLESRPGEIRVKENGKYGVIDKKGNQIINSIYDSITGDGYLENSEYEKTGYIVGIKQKDGYEYGYINSSGRAYVKPSYEELKRVNILEDDVYLIVRENGRYGIIKNKKLLANCEFTELQYNENAEVFLVKQRDRYCILNKQGKKVIDTEFDSCQVSGKYILAKKEEESKLYDVYGNQITNAKYESISAVKDKAYYIAIDNEGMYSIVNKDKIIEDNYLSITYAFDDYFIFETENSKSGILDAEKGIIIDAIYDYIILAGELNVIEAGTFDNDIIDIYSRRMEKILSLDSAVVEMASNEYLKITSGNTLKYLDKDGKLVESNIVYKNNKLYSYAENEKWGFKDVAGNVKVEAKYDLVTELNEYGFAGIKKDELWGVIDSNGNVIVEPKYDLGNVYTPEFIGEYYMQIVDLKECIKQ